MKAVVFTLGCKVNDCESASLLRGLAERGWEVSDELVPADLYILNTCAVTAEAEKKSRQAIARIRAVSPQARIVVCGCAAERAPEAFAGRENVTLVTGAQHKSAILGMLDEGGIHIAPPQAEYDEMLPPKRCKTRAFVKIQDGCNHFCSYCIIPYLRGRSRSRSLESAAREILSAQAEEVVITGIDISSYRDGERTLADLLYAVKDASCRIRLGSLETAALDERLLDAAAAVRDFAPQFHLSLQSGSNAVLRAMNRHYTREQFLEQTERIRARFPDAAITTDIIAGYPTETDSDFEDTLDLARRARFANIHCFTYSRRTGTVAAKLPDLPAAVKKERMHRLLSLAEELRRGYEERWLGKVLHIVPEEYRDGATEGYSENYIRLYVPARLSGKRAVVPVRPYRDGLWALPAEQAESAAERGGQARTEGERAQTTENQGGS